MYTCGNDQGADLPQSIRRTAPAELLAISQSAGPASRSVARRSVGGGGLMVRVAPPTRFASLSAAGLLLNPARTGARGVYVGGASSGVPGGFRGTIREIGAAAVGLAAAADDHATINKATALGARDLHVVRSNW